MKPPSPLLGFNNNVRHKGRVFHIQTEDSGVRHPHIITHLFADGGRILKTTKTSYAEFIDAANMGEVVRQMMQDQHKAMFMALRDGQFDHLVDELPTRGGTTQSRMSSPGAAAPPATSSPAVSGVPAPTGSAPGLNAPPTSTGAVSTLAATGPLSTRDVRGALSREAPVGPPPLPLVNPLASAATIPQAPAVRPPPEVAPVARAATAEPARSVPAHEPIRNVPALGYEPARGVPSLGTEPHRGAPVPSPETVRGVPVVGSETVRGAVSPAVHADRARPGEPLRPSLGAVPPAVSIPTAPPIAIFPSVPPAESPSSPPASPSQRPPRIPPAAPGGPVTRPTPTRQASARPRLDIDPAAIHRAPEPEHASTLASVVEATVEGGTGIDLDTLERAAAEAETPLFQQINDLPPPPAAVIGARSPSHSPGGYSSVAPPIPPAPAPPSTRGRYAPSRPSSIFASVKPQEGASIFGEDLISEKSLDEVILSYLAEDLDGPGEKK